MVEETRTCVSGEQRDTAARGAVPYLLCVFDEEYVDWQASPSQTRYYYILLKYFNRFQFYRNSENRFLVFSTNFLNKVPGWQKVTGCSCLLPASSCTRRILLGRPRAGPGNQIDSLLGDLAEQGKGPIGNA